MGDPRSVKKIGIFGHVGNQNLGDEAIIAAVIQNIRHRYADAKIYGFTINPEDAQQRHGIRAFPIRRTDKKRKEGKRHSTQTMSARQPEEQSNLRQRIKIGLKTIPLLYAFLKRIHKSLFLLGDCLEELMFLVKCYRNLTGIDLLIIAGSQQLSDYFGGAWGFPYTLFKWSVIAKLVGAKVVFLGVGAGPLHSWLGRFFVKYSLFLASYRSYRDESSKKLIEEIGVSGEKPVCPDLVYSLEIVKPSRSTKAKSLSTVGINPMPFFDERYWPMHNSDIYHSYVKKLASLALWLIQRGYAVVFFPTQLRADPPVICDIKASMKNNGFTNFEQQLVDRPILTFEDLVSQISIMDIVIATRFHGILFSFLLNKPVLGISYHKKTDELMARMGQSEYVLDIKGFDCGSLIERFISLESKSEAIKEEIEHRLSVCRYALETQYERVFGLLEQGHGVEVVVHPSKTGHLN